MPVPSVRTIVPEGSRNFGRAGDTVEVPPLTDIQLHSYSRFLQLDVPPESARPAASKACCAKSSPSRATTRASRSSSCATSWASRATARRMPATAPHLWPAVPRLAAPGEGPARRRRSLSRRHADHDRRRRVSSSTAPNASSSASCTARPASISSSRSKAANASCTPAASFRNVAAGSRSTSPRKRRLGVRIDQSGKFSSMTLLRAMDPAYSTDADILKAFYPTEDVKITPANRERLEGAVTVGDIIDPETGEVYHDSGHILTKEKIDQILCQSRHGCDDPRQNEGRIDPQVARRGSDQHARGSAAKDLSASPSGQSAAAEKARELFREKFQDANRYRLGKVGRFRINRKFDQDIPESEMTLRALDYLTRSATSSSCAPAKATSTISTTWAIAGCARSTSWPRTNCARASSSCGARCRSA